jgi:dTDP-4-dehydrorhamnose reductase
MTNVLILGGTGMLGHAVIDEFRGFEGTVKFTSRTVSGIPFNVLTDSVRSLASHISAGDYIVNCLGITKPHIDDHKEQDVARATQVNSLFPTELALFAEQADAKIIQIATDCVFSGRKGHYLETDTHDAEDVYGKSKSKGEVVSPNVMHIRVSTIGREINRSTLLLEWVLSHPQGATIPGYTDHFWNGVTTNHFAKVVRGMIELKEFKSGLSHLVPSNELSKAELVRKIAIAFGRRDLIVKDTESGKPINRTLATNDPELNKILWGGAGYAEIPTIEQLIAEIAG